MRPGDRFLAACRGDPVDRTPIWLMRQAGRYMEEYRSLREHQGILDIIRTPELAVQVTLQPMTAFDLDAAIVFADILPLIATMGLDLEFVPGKGPVIHNPVRTREDIEALIDPPVRDSVGYTLEAVRLARQELEGRSALIGFSGAPFTLAAYAVEGGSSRNFEHVKGLMFEDPVGWELLMSKLAGRVGRYLKRQAEAGAHALQLFDTWAGELSPADYAARVLPHSRRVIAVAHEAGVPVLHFTRGTAGYLETVADAGADVMSVDWRVDLGAARARLEGRPIQGNLDPVALLGPWHAVRDATDRVLRSAGGRPGHIFNLGHGILPATPPGNVARLVEYVHGATRRG